MSANGGDVSNGGADVLAKIHQALEVVHSPFSANEARREAQMFLERVKELPDAPLQGHRLAADKARPPVIRHYGLSLLDYAIQYQWSSYNQAQASVLRNWVIELSQAISREDPAYLRNKVAQLWVEVAKRCWVPDWLDMDAMLVHLWLASDSTAHKEFVMLVLETLSDEVFGTDDSSTTKDGTLSKACVDIFTPMAVLAKCFPNRQPGPDVRKGHEGWIGRIAEFLNLCINSNAEENDEVKACTIRAFSVLLSLMPWAVPEAIIATQCVNVMTAGLASSSIEVRKVCGRPSSVSARRPC